MCIPGTALSRYTNFYTDFAFKKFFGTEANKDLLISFLNCLLEREGSDAIADLTYMNNEKLGASNSDRRAIYDVNCKTPAGERLNFIFLEMPNFKKTEKELETFKDKWLFAIKNLYKLQDKPAVLTEGIFKKLFKEAEIAAYSRNERYNYEESLKNARDMNGVISSAEIRGRAEGRAEEARSNALKMKTKGFDYSDISEITGLSIEEIEKL